MPGLVRELASLADKQIDVFSHVDDQLAYYGQLSLLVEAMRLAWPAVASEDILPWGIDEFVSKARMYELLNHVELTAEPNASDPAVIERLELYGEIAPSTVAPIVEHLTGRARRQWTMNNFEFSASRRDRDEDEEDAAKPSRGQPNGGLNLYYLTVEFLGHVRRVEGMPYSKADLGRSDLYRFIVKRHGGELEYRDSMLQSTRRELKLGGRRAPKRKFRYRGHLLVPDHERLDRYLAGLLDMLDQQHYRAAALFEIIPAWLRFLEGKGLIDAAARTTALNDLGGLTDTMCRFFDTFGEDPSPRKALQSWREDANRDLSE